MRQTHACMCVAKHTGSCQCPLAGPVRHNYVCVCVANHTGSCQCLLAGPVSVMSVTQTGNRTPGMNDTVPSPEMMHAQVQKSQFQACSSGTRTNDHLESEHHPSLMTVISDSFPSQSLANKLLHYPLQINSFIILCK